MKPRMKFDLSSVKIAVICLYFGGCGPSYQPEDVARKEVAAQEVLRKSQVAEEAAANAELKKGEKR